MKPSIVGTLGWVYVPIAASVTITACGSDRAGEGEAAAVWDTLPNGAVHVSYSQLATTPHVRVEADLHLGSADAEGEAVFGEIRGIDVDHEGRILVLDHQASELKAFDSDGRFIELIAGSGEGPHEISAANGIRVDAENSIWINDHGRARLTRLMPDGEVETYQRFIPGYGYLWEGGVTRDGRIWSDWSHSDRPPAPPSTGVHHTDSRLYYKSFDPASETYDSVFVGTATYHAIALRGERGGSVRQVPFSSQRLHVLDPAGFIWTAISDQYLLTKLDTSGDTVLVVQAEADAPLITQAERDEAIESVEVVVRRIGVRVDLNWDELLPERKPLLEQLIVDDEGNLWVERVTADGHVFDVFDESGRYSATVEPDFDFVPYFPPVIRGGNLYALQLDSLDVPYVVRGHVGELRWR